MQPPAYRNPARRRPAPWHTAAQLLDHRFDGMLGADPGDDRVDWDVAMIAALRAGDDQHAAAKMTDRA